MRNQRDDLIPMEIRMIVPFACWMARHPKWTNVVIALMAAIMVWVVLNYEFTTY